MHPCPRPNPTHRNPHASPVADCDIITVLLYFFRLQIFLSSILMFLKFARRRQTILRTWGKLSHQLEALPCRNQYESSSVPCQVGSSLKGLSSNFTKLFVQPNGRSLIWKIGVIQTIENFFRVGKSSGSY